MSISEIRHSLGGSQSKPTIFYTDTTSLIEKNLLLAKQRKIIDVSSPEQESLKSLLLFIQLMSDEFPEFQLRKIEATKFQPLPASEREVWASLLSEIQAGLAIPGRVHEVEVERFLPKGVPVMVTDLTIDTRALQELRTGLETIPNADASGLGRVLDNLASRGSTLVLHINANNENMHSLATAQGSDVSSSLALATCWRAIVQHFGWRGGREIMTREAAQYDSLISSALALYEETAQLRVRETDLASQVHELESQLGQERARNVPIPEGQLEAIVGFVDIVDSTKQLIGNLKSSPADRNRFIESVLRHVSSSLGSVGSVCGFTGDGLQFYLEKPIDPGSHRRALRVLLQLTESVKDLCESDQEIREIVSSARIPPPGLRAAMSYGEVRRCRVVSDLDLIGLPAVEASRLCGMKELYASAECSFLMTEDAYNAGAVWQLWKAADFLLLSETEFRGLEGHPVRIYHSSDH
jgi:class 3 adenylate cyclase